MLIRAFAAKFLRSAGYFLNTSLLGSQLRARIQASLSLRSDRGFLLMETVAAMAILAVTSLAVASVLTAGINSQKTSRDRTVAEQVTTLEMEKIRQLPYTSVGVVNGNPAGNLVASETIAGTGLTISRSIKWVNDPAPSAVQTGADYKRITLTISKGSQVLATHATYLSPSDDVSYGSTTHGRVKVQVIDMATMTPVGGVPVALTNGPSPNSSDTTDASGYVTFPSLLPNPASGGQAYYDVTITPPSGFVTLPDDLPGATNSPAHLKVAAGALTSPVLRMYRPATVILNVKRFGLAYTGSATVTLSSSRGSNNYTFTGGSYTVPTGQVSGLQYTATATGSSVTSAGVTQTVPNLATYPDILTSTFTLDLPNLIVTVKRKPTSSACTTVSGAVVTVKRSGFPDLVAPATGSNGIATFVATPASGYTIQVTSSFGNKTLTSQTVLASPNATNITVSVVGSCP